MAELYFAAMHVPSPEWIKFAFSMLKEAFTLSRSGFKSFAHWKVDRAVLRLANEGFDVHHQGYLHHESCITPEWVWTAASATGYDYDTVWASLQRLKNEGKFLWQKELKAQSLD